MSARSSIYGPLSLALPVCGLAAEAVSVQIHSPMGQSTAMTVFFLSVFSTFMLGIAFSVVGMVRGEQLRWLPAIGFGFNLILIALHFSA